jgi:cytochrome P450
VRPDYKSIWDLAIKQYAHLGSQLRLYTGCTSRKETIMTMGTTARTFPFGTQNGIDADPTLRELRESEPVCRVRMADGAQAWLVTRYEDVRAVESDPRMSKQAAMRPGVAMVSPSIVMVTNLVNLDPPEHTRVRKLLTAAFTSRRIELLRPRAEEIADGLLDAMAAAGPPVELYRSFAYQLPITVMAELLGMPYSDNNMFQRWMTAILAVGDAPIEDKARAFADMRRYVTELIAAKRAQPGKDLLTAMIQANEDGDRLTDDELLAHTEMFIMAGQDTTANMISNSVITLFRHPDQLELLRQRPELIPNAVEELLRFVPNAIGGTTRVATEDIELRGVTIQAGDAVITVEQAANRDPEAFPDPDQFDITRPPKPSHAAFGHGVHFCLGANLARMEMAVALAGLLRRFPTLRLAVPDESLRWIPNQILYRVQELPVTW